MPKTSSADTQFKLHFLQSSPIFQSTSEDDLAELARCGKLQAFPSRKQIAKSGRKSDSIYVVQSGVIAELHPISGARKSVLVDLFGAGEAAGLVNATARTSATEAAATRHVQSLTPVSALVIPTADFFRISRRSPELESAILGELSLRTLKLDAKLGEAAHATLEARLAGLFSRISDLSSGDDWNPTVSIGHISQTGIAEMLGVSREHVNRTFSMWERSGLIFLNRSGELVVQNRKRLATISRDHRQAAHAEKIDEWLWEIDAHLDHGLNQSATHLALEAVKRAPRELRYKHKAVLATARSGSVSEALALFDQLGLDENCDNEEIACLRPRLLRDLAFLTDSPKARHDYLVKSAKSYDAAFKKCQGFYSGINAASGYAFLGERKKSETICSKVTKLLENQTGDADIDEEITQDYWHRVTLAEAKLLEGDKPNAKSLFRSAAAADDVASGKKATTRRQLIRLASYLQIEPEWIEDAVPQARPLFFSGPLAGKTAAETETQISDLLEALDGYLAKNDVGWAYGALASGADIAIAELLIESGVRLNAYLPLSPAKFIKSSVYTGGEKWVSRFENCMRAAASVEWNHRIKVPSKAAYRLGAYAAMGKTIRHAEQLETTPLGFFAVQSGLEPSQSLSVANLEAWRANNLDYESICGQWPKKNGANTSQGTSPNSYFALIVEREDGKKIPKKFSAAGAERIQISELNLELVLFETAEQTAATATEFAKTAGAANSRIWLDAGVVDINGSAKSPSNTVEAFISAACRPLTTPGAIYATEVFAYCHTILGKAARRFEYLGFVNTREKLDPCPMYSVVD